MSALRVGAARTPRELESLVPTDRDVEQAIARADAASPGPWTLAAGSEIIRFRARQVVCRVPHVADRDFLLRARVTVLQLGREVQRQRGRSASIEAENATLKVSCERQDAGLAALAERVALLEGELAKSREDERALAELLGHVRVEVESILQVGGALERSGASHATLIGDAAPRLERLRESLREDDDPEVGPLVPRVMAQEQGRA